jgi:hypothetical protein
MKIEELAAQLKPKTNDPKVVIKDGEVVGEQRPLGPTIRPDRLLGPAPFSMCFPHTGRSLRERHTQAAIDEALEGMDQESRFDALLFNPVTHRFSRHTNHLGGVEL